MSLEKGENELKTTYQMPEFCEVSFKTEELLGPSQQDVILPKEEDKTPSNETEIGGLPIEF